MESVYEKYTTSMKVYMCIKDILPPFPITRFLGLVGSAIVCDIYGFWHSFDLRTENLGGKPLYFLLSSTGYIYY